MPSIVAISSPQYTISGKILDKFNIPVSGFIVEALDNSLRSQLQLNDLQENEKHKYKRLVKWKKNVSTPSSILQNIINKALLFALTLLSLNLFGQENPTEQAQPIVVEGKLLYKSEMASWFGTDLFLKKYKGIENPAGYFSYTIREVSKCIFFSRSDKPKVIGTISFDSTYDLKSAKIDLTEREFTQDETALYTIRKITLDEINSDTLFKTYKNTNFNVIPLIDSNGRRVYVLTAPQQNGLVIIGNDYLLTFDNDNKLILKKQIHKNIIPFNYKEVKRKKIVSGIHNHLPETGDFITATDICTIMLYGKSVKWKTHYVGSDKYLNIWNCETNQLTVTSIDEVNNTNIDEE